MFPFRQWEGVQVVLWVWGLEPAELHTNVQWNETGKISF